MPAYTLSRLSIRPEEGLTPGGKLHRFQQRTVDRLEVMARGVGEEAITELRSRMDAAYSSPDATGRLARSAKVLIKSSREKGVSMSIAMGDFREARFLTNMGGGRWRSHAYYIWPVNKRFLTFYWKREQVRFRGMLVKHPGFPMGDIPMEVMTKYGREFSQRAVQTVGRGLTELTAGSQNRSKFRPITRNYKR